MLINGKDPEVEAARYALYKEAWVNAELPEGHSERLDLPGVTNQPQFVSEVHRWVDDQFSNYLANPKSIANDFHTVMHNSFYAQAATRMEKGTHGDIVELPEAANALHRYVKTHIAKQLVAS